MRCASVKNLCKTFKITNSNAKRIRQVWKFHKNSNEFLDFIEVNYNSKYNTILNDRFDSKRVRRLYALEIINGIIGTHGIESALHNDCITHRYLNSGDVYNPTLIASVSGDNLYIGCTASLARSR